jgi:ATP-binding cassette subfamily F protein uup
MRSRTGDVLLLAETISKSHDGEKTLFSGLTFSVV